MDSTTAFLAGLAVTAAGGIVAHFVVRAGAAGPRAQRVPDGSAWLETHQRRVRTFADFAAPADQIAHIVALWPALPAEARPAQRDQAREHMQLLERRRGAVMLDSDKFVQAAATDVVERAAYFVQCLRHDDAEPGPADPLKHSLTLFLVAGRELLDAESERHLDLRAAGRSLFARLSTR
jgi:hypothetical protein